MPPHRRGNFAVALSQQMVVLGHQPVAGRRKGLEGFVGKARPVTREKMVVEHVDHHAGKAAPARPNSRATMAKRRVRIRETIEAAMQRHTRRDLQGQVAGQRPLDKVAYQSADAQCGVGAGEQRVGEEVHRAQETGLAAVSLHLLNQTWSDDDFLIRTGRVAALSVVTGRRTTIDQATRNRAVANAP